MKTQVQDLFSIQTVIGNKHLQNKQQEIIDQLAVILLDYLELVNQWLFQ